MGTAYIAARKPKKFFLAMPAASYGLHTNAMLPPFGFHKVHMAMWYSFTDTHTVTTKENT